MVVKPNPYIFHLYSMYIVHPIASNSRRTKLLPPSSLPLCCSLRCCTRSAPGSSSSSPSLGWTVWEPWWPPMLSASSLECSSSSWRSGRGRQWGCFGSVSPSSPLPCNWPVWLCGQSSTGFNQSGTFNSLVQGREWHRYSLVVADRSLPDILWLVGIVCPRGRHLEQVTPSLFLECDNFQVMGHQDKDDRRGSQIVHLPSHCANQGFQTILVCPR